MPGRPAINAEVQRHIFVEAGHRCAVCGTTFPLERAHIIPWARSKDHSPENLICLCANCHERADHDWDEATLRKYKECPWVLRQNHPPPATVMRPTTVVQVTVDLEFDQFDNASQRWLKYALAAFLETVPEAVRVRSVEKGSVKLTIELDSDDALRLQRSFDAKDRYLHKILAPLTIKSIVSAPEKTPLARLPTVVESALVMMCDTLNSQEGPFPSLRNRLARELGNEETPPPTISVEALHRLLVEHLPDVYRAVRRWLQRETDFEHNGRLRAMVDILAAASLDPQWVIEMSARLDSAHVEVPMWSTVALCEPMLTALFGEPATWTANRYIENDFHYVETPSAQPANRAKSIRRHLATKYFASRVAREIGESNGAFEARLDDFINASLPAVLEVEREDRTPYFVLYDEHAAGLRRDMEIDPQLWSQILKLERRRELAGVFVDEPKVSARLTAIFEDLDRIAERQKPRPNGE